MAGWGKLYVLFLIITICLVLVGAGLTISLVLDEAKNLEHDYESSLIKAKYATLSVGVVLLIVTILCQVNCKDEKKRAVSPEEKPEFELQPVTPPYQTATMTLPRQETTKPRSGSSQQVQASVHDIPQQDKRRQVTVRPEIPQAKPGASGITSSMQQVASPEVVSLPTSSEPPSSRSTSRSASPPSPAKVSPKMREHHVSFKVGP